MPACAGVGAGEGAAAVVRRGRGRLGLLAAGGAPPPSCWRRAAACRGQRLRPIRHAAFQLPRLPSGRAQPRHRAWAAAGPRARGAWRWRLRRQRARPACGAPHLLDGLQEARVVGERQEAARQDDVIAVTCGSGEQAGRASALAPARAARRGGPAGGGAGDNGGRRGAPGGPRPREPGAGACSGAPGRPRGRGAAPGARAGRAGRRGPRPATHHPAPGPRRTVLRAVGVQRRRQLCLAHRVARPALTRGATPWARGALHRSDRTAPRARGSGVWGPRGALLCCAAGGKRRSGR
jgi:hypothetical protein